MADEALKRLEELAGTHKGRAKIRERANEIKERISNVVEQGNFKKLPEKEKAAFNSPEVRYGAVEKALRDSRAKDLARLPREVVRFMRGIDFESPPAPRRVRDIPKADGGMRSISVGDLESRVKEAVLRQILEAEWSGRLSEYGYCRRGRGVIDAIAAICEAIYRRPQWVLRADIRNCYESIDRNFVLEKRRFTHFLRELLERHLAPGYLVNGETRFDESGIPTGCSLSALILEIVLKGMDDAVVAGLGGPNEPLYVRYADDIVVIHPDREVVEECQRRLEAWLKGATLELNRTKTRIVPTLCLISRAAGGRIVAEKDRIRTFFKSAYDYELGRGFSFLGVQVSQYPSPDNTEYETWVEVRVPKGRVIEKRKEGRQEEYLRAIKQQVRGLREVIGDKAYVGDSYTHNYETYPPAEPESDEVSFIQVADEVKAISRRHEEQGQTRVAQWSNEWKEEGGTAWDNPPW